MAAQTAVFAADGGDPRLNSATGQLADSVLPSDRRLHDPNVMFEEYLHYAKLTRAEEAAAADKGPAAGERTGILAVIFPTKSDKGVERRESVSVPTSDSEMKEVGKPDGHIAVTDREWTNASRAMRTATWSAIFYLITTDTLGPFGLPFSFGTLGWGPGVALYTVFGGFALYGGYLLWVMFLGLDSYQYPMRTYGDLAFRIYGQPVRHAFNFLQSVQLLCNVGAIIISTGLSLSQISKFRLCYAICALVWALCGMIIGQVRTLQKFGWLANFSIWLNVLIIFITMGVAAHSVPNFSAAQTASAGFALGGASVTQLPDGSFPAVVTSGGLPPDSAGFVGSVNGLMQAVYAYGGAMLFTEFMSEMRRPRDFLKALCGATGFIYLLYMLYGLYMYGFQGQYTVNPSYQGVSPFAWQTVGNVLSIFSTLIAAGLYGNIGIKVLYNNLLMEWFHFPELHTKKGKIAWVFIVPVYWSLAFIIAAAIPNFFGFTSIVAAMCILHFTYTFPPFLHVGYMIHKNAIQPGEGFDPATGQVIRHDHGMKRWVRGFMKHRPYWNVWNVLYTGGALATAGLGSFSAIEALIAAFKTPQTGAFTCHSPLDSS